MEAADVVPQKNINSRECRARLLDNPDDFGLLFGGQLVEPNAKRSFIEIGLTPRFSRIRRFFS